MSTVSPDVVPCAQSRALFIVASPSLLVILFTVHVRLFFAYSLEHANLSLEPSHWLSSNWILRSGSAYGVYAQAS